MANVGVEEKEQGDRLMNDVGKARIASRLISANLGVQGGYICRFYL